MIVTDLVNPGTSIADYQQQAQTLIDDGHQVYLRVVGLDGLHINYDHPLIKLADGSVVQNLQAVKEPVSGDDMAMEFPARELLATGLHRIAFKDHYTPQGKHVVDEWITIHADKVMMFPVVKAIFLLANYGRILEELDGVKARKLMLAQQVAEDAAAEKLDVDAVIATNADRAANHTYTCQAPAWPSPRPLSRRC
jgi:hypothetical protein